MNKYKLFVTGISLLLLSNITRAQDAATPATVGSNDTFLLIIIGFLLLVVLVMSIMLQQMGTVVREIKKGAGAEKVVGGLRAWWGNLDKRIFTKAVPVEKEADVMMDHDYDGIKELDNALPPWWKWGFYFTLIVAVFYILRFHVWKTGPDPIQEYNSEMAYAAKKAESRRATASEEVDEKTVTMADAAGIAAGKIIFLKNCSACHGSTGEGGIGPNLTDNYWLHGGTINEVFKTIKYGVPEKGMQSWQKAFSSGEIKELASFVKSIGGSNPPNPKAPQGNLFTPAADSTAILPADTTKVQ
ncbi:MAG: c-type cytochrome [Terrimonas sp.]|nr:c-type cytochrome [Terrimonas sp.]